MTEQERKRRQREHARRYRERHPDRAKASVNRYRATERAKQKAKARRGVYENSPKAAASRQKLRESRAAFVRDQKKGPCADCGMRFHPAAMDFDHCRGTKSFIFSRVGGRRRAEILAELAKCDLVCANCHRVRTWARKRIARYGELLTVVA